MYNKMHVIKKYKDTKNIFETTIDECIKNTEKKGYYAKGAIKKLWKEDIKIIIETPYAIWFLIK